MKCPTCGAMDSRVLDSRPIEDGSSIRRRRECNTCQRRFTTYETLETLPLMVQKKDGTRQIFDKHKLEAGLLKACQKRPVDVSLLVSEIEQELNNQLLNEIPSTVLGEMVMERLRKLDAVSYVRFASVYREFKDVDTFFSELKKMMNQTEADKS